MAKWDRNRLHPTSKITAGTFRNLDSTIERINDRLEICPNDPMMHAVSRQEDGATYVLDRFLGARGVRVLRVAQIDMNGLSREIMLRNDAENVGEVSLFYAMGFKTQSDLQNLHRVSNTGEVILSDADAEFTRQDIVRRDKNVPFTAEQMVFSAFTQRAGIYSAALN